MSDVQGTVEAVAPASAVETKPIHESFREAALSQLPTEPVGGGATPSAEVKAPVVETPAQVKSRVVADYLKSQYQADLGDVTDEDLAPQIGHILESNQLLEQRLAERERQLSEFLAKRQEFDQFLASQAKAQPVASQEVSKPLEPKVKPLQYDPDWEHLASLDKETGLWSPKAKFGLQAIEAAEKLNQYVREQADRARRLVSDPLSLLRDAGLENELQQIRAEFQKERDALKKELEDKFNQFPTQLQQQAEQRRAQSSVEQWVQERSGDLFAQDAQGRVMFRGDAPITTEKGACYQKAAVEARDFYGITDPVKVHAYAKRVYEMTYPVVQAETPVPVATPAAPTPTLQETNEALKRKFLEKGKSPGSVQPASREQAPSAAVSGRSGNAFLHRFRDMALSDEANADVLGALYKG